MKKLHLFTLLALFSLQVSAEVVPSAKIKLKELFAQPVINKITKSSSKLQDIIKKYSNTEVTIESYFLDQEKKYRSQPNAGLVGNAEMTSSDGDYSRLTAATTNGVMIKKRSYKSFMVILKYRDKNKKGILMIPFWADVDLRNKDPKIKKWGILDKEVSFFSEDIKKKNK